MPQSEAGTLGRPRVQAGLRELQTRPRAWRGPGWEVGQSPQRLGMHPSAHKRSQRNRVVFLGNQVSVRSPVLPKWQNLDLVPGLCPRANVRTQARVPKGCSGLSYPQGHPVLSDGSAYQACSPLRVKAQEAAKLCPPHSSLPSSPRPSPGQAQCISRSARWSPEATQPGLKPFLPKRFHVFIRKPGPAHYSYLSH